MPNDAEAQSNHQSSRFSLLSIWLGIGAIVMLVMIVGGLLIDRQTSLSFAPRQVETTGSGDSTREAREPEIDSITGAPLTHLGPGDLVAGSQALKHPAPMRRDRPR
jgi:hypothetical protein